MTETKTSGPTLDEHVVTLNPVVGLSMEDLLKAAASVMQEVIR